MQCDIAQQKQQHFPYEILHKIVGELGEDLRKVKIAVCVCVKEIDNSTHSYTANNALSISFNILFDLSTNKFNNLNTKDNNNNKTKKTL